MQDSSLARRLFDHELDNQHEEPLLLAQLAAVQLNLLMAAVPPVSVPPGGAFGGDAAGWAVLLPWLLTASERLEQASAALQQQHQKQEQKAAAAASSACGGGGGGGCSGDSSSSSWAGGLAGHPTTFAFLFRCVLPFWAVSPGMVEAATAVAAADAPPKTMPPSLDPGADKVVRKMAASDVIALLRARLEVGLCSLCPSSIATAAASDTAAGPMAEMVAEVARRWGITLGVAVGSSSLLLSSSHVVRPDHPQVPPSSGEGGDLLPLPSAAGLAPLLPVASHHSRRPLFLLDGGPCLEAWGGR